MGAREMHLKGVYQERLNFTTCDIGILEQGNINHKHFLVWTYEIKKLKHWLFQNESHFMDIVMDQWYWKYYTQVI